jgi:hypothetical protein
MASGAGPVRHALQVQSEIAQRDVQHVNLKPLDARPVHLVERNITAKSSFDREADGRRDMVFYELLEFPVDRRTDFKRNALV